MAQIFHEAGVLGTEAGLPALQSLVPATSTAKEKIDLVLRLLRQAAVERREPKGRPFYSIRTVAKHFSLPPTTVTRLYGQLKTEGVLGSIWGSKTIIEPVDVDKDIRLKAIVGLPVSLGQFSLAPGYRKFFRVIQHTLWRQRFGSQLVFYENGFGESSKFADTLLDYNADVVIWLTPSSRMSNTIARLRDRGVRLITIADETPINGESGYFISRRDALIEGLAAWKIAGIQSAIILDENQCALSSTQRMLQAALMDAGIPFTRQAFDTAGSNASPRKSDWRQSGIIFASAQSVVRFAYTDVAGLRNLSQQNRTMFLEGRMDLPIETRLNGNFDAIEFDWRTVARRIASNLATTAGESRRPSQEIFKAKWCGATRLEKESRYRQEIYP